MALLALVSMANRMPLDEVKLVELARRCAVESVNIHEAKARLSQLIARTQQGEGFIIAKAGKPVVRVSPIDSPAPEQHKRLGFLADEFRVPDDFDRMAEQGID